MQSLRNPNPSRASLTLALILAAAMAVPTSLLAQEANASMPEKPQPQAKSARVDYSHPVRHFPNPVGPYLGKAVADPVFSNTPRIDQLVKDGKLVLSLSDAISLALENNLDLAIARYNLSIADTDILRAQGGGGIGGVSTGLVSGTPGGGQGGFGTGASGAGSGGTSAGAGGAGAGTAGLVTSTLGAGASVEQFDPSVTGTLQFERARFPQANTITSGVPVFEQNTTIGNFTYNQGFATGTAMSVSFNNQRAATNSLFNSLNPQLTSTFRLTVRQRLLQGFGTANNLRFIRIARNNRKISDMAFKNQIISTVSQIQNIYWDLVSAYEDVKVKQRALALAEKTLRDNKKQVEIGTLAPIEIVRAQSEVATRNQDLIVSQTALQLQQTLMINAVSRTLNDPKVANLPVVPTDSMTVVKDPVPDVELLVKQAMEQRPELEQTRLNLVNSAISKKAAKNGLLPAFDLFAFYGASGLSGLQNPRNAIIPPGAIPATGYNDAFQNLFNSSAPDKGIGVSMTISIRNRTAQAVQTRSELEYRQAELLQQQQMNTINIGVRNAAYALQQNTARVEAARAGRELAAQSLDAEQKRYALGASTNTLVLQAQRDLAQAESNYVSALAAYEKSRVQLDQVTGNTLKNLGISIPDSEVGVVGAAPTVTGTTPPSDKD